MSWLETKELTLPSGKAVTIAKVAITAALMREVPNISVLADADTKNPENLNKEQAEASIDFAYYLIQKSVKKPKFVLEETEEDLENDIIWVGRLTEEDIEAIVAENVGDELEAASNAATFQHGERSLIDSDSSSDIPVSTV